MSGDKAAGALLAAAAGDALGWPQELRGGLLGGKRARAARDPDPRFHSWTRRAGSRFRGYYQDHVRAGSYSDDTQLLCASARACLQGDDWLRWLSEVELPAWLTYQRGGGRAVLAAASRWSGGAAPWLSGSTIKSKEQVARYREAGANGVAMRIAPHVLYCHSRDTSYYSRVILDGICTHGHPRALVGALTFATALGAAYTCTGKLEYGALVSGAREGIVSSDEIADILPPRWSTNEEFARFERIWTATNTEMSKLLDEVERSLSRGSMSSTDQTLQILGCSGSRSSGAGTVTAAGAIYLASRAAARPLSGLLSAAFAQEADTDTLASMTGSLLGAVHGTAWLGDLFHVQDAEYIVSLADSLTARSPKLKFRRPSKPVTDLAKDLIRAIEMRDQSLKAAEFPDGRRFEVREIESLGSSGTAVRWHLRLDDGQTVVVDDTNATKQVVDDSNTQRSTHSLEKAFNPGRLNGTVFVDTSRFSACVDFYGRVIGQSLPVNNGIAHVTDWLTLSESSENLPQSGMFRITLRVASLRDAAGRLALNLPAEQSNHLSLLDPDGRIVRIEQISQ